jgi:CheY-like chemotaxis protein
VTLAEDPRIRPQLFARPDSVRLLDQLTAIDAWIGTRRATEEWAAEPVSRELRLDRARRLDVVRRQHRALLQATERQQQEEDGFLRLAPAPRAVVVHRNDWFKDKVCTRLRAAGVEVVAELSNGADAVGVVVAEQPDVLLVEDKLPMLSGLDVLREVRRFAPSTRVVAQVADDGQIGAFLEVGACTAFTRRIPPADIADAVCDLLALGVAG